MAIGGGEAIGRGDVTVMGGGDLGGVVVGGGAEGGCGGGELA